MALQRLQRILARAGIASRRKAEELIREGRVTVDGAVASLGQKADPESQEIAVDGVPVQWPPPTVYLVLNKPPGYLCTRHRHQGERIVFDLLPEALRDRLVMVGRLDRDSEGLMIFTTDGELAYRLMHPRFRVPRVYRVLVSGAADAIGAVRRGVKLDDGPAKPEKAEIVKRSPQGLWVELVLREGRKREVRRMCQAVGWKVQRLIRVAYGPVRLGNLPEGHYRALCAEELRLLRQAVGLPLAEQANARTAGE